MEFHIQSSYSPKGDQPKAIEEITKSFQEGNKKVTLVGVTGSGKTFTMANVIQNLKVPTLVMCHNKTLAAQLYREFKEFFPNNAIEYFVSYYDYYQPEAYVSAKDLYIEKDLSINDEIDKLRLKATSSLLERDDVIIISSVSCIYGLGSPEDYYNMAFSLEIGQSIDRDEVVKNLIKVQYERNDIDFSRGNFRVKGDILELFPSYLEYGIRVEFFGDEVEAISQIHPLSGKILLKMEKVYVYPAKHFVTEPYKIKLGIQRIKDELQERIHHFDSEKKLVESQRIESRTNYDIEMLQEMGYCNGVENYSRHLSGREEGQRPACLIDYFREKFLLIIDESHITVPQIRGMYAGDRNRKQNLVDFGFRLPSALDNRPLNFNEFEKLTPYTLYVSATPADYEIEKSQSQVEQIIRPTGLLDPIVEVRSTKGQLDNLYLEMQKRIKIKERVLITTLTKKTAEDLSDYLTDLGVKSKYLHSEIDTLERVEIIRDLRRGDYDCIVGINLLREGLDIPEVSLVAILESDKEGFLRNFRSLIQTIGRAARNSNGMAILYADKVTDSMKAAMDETNRRRKIQEEHNQKYSITPKTIKKEVKDIIDRFGQVEEKKKNNLTSDLKRKFSLKNYKSENDIKKAIKEEIIQLSKELKFEEAALHRDYAFKYFGGL